VYLSNQTLSFSFTFLSAKENTVNFYNLFGFAISKRPGRNEELRFGRKLKTIILSTHYHQK